MFKKNIFIFLLCFGIQLSSAQKYAFKKYTAENGLSHDFVNDIIQTKDGYIWIATKNGVSKFNGKAFENFNAEEGLNSENINVVFEDSKGRLWIGSSDKGAYYLENGEITSLEDIHKPDYYSVNDFLEAKDGTIYMFCNNGVLVYKDDLKKVISLISTTENSIKPKQAAWIDDNTIYIATLDTGIVVLKLNEEHISYINNETHDINDVTYSILKDKDDIVWVGTQSELLKLKNQNLVARYGFDPKYFNINAITDIVNKSETVLVLTLEANGFAIFNKITGTFDGPINLNNGLPNRFVHAVIEDNENNFWLATQGSGLVRFRDKGIKLFDDSMGLLSNNVFSMTATKNKTYVATALGVNSIENNKILDTIYDFGSAAFIKAYDDTNVMFSNFSSIVEFSEDEKLKFNPEEKGLFTYLYKNDRASLIFNFYKTKLRVIEKDTTYVFSSSDKFQPIPYIRDLIEIDNHFVYMTRHGVFEIKKGEINQIEFDYKQVDVRSLVQVDNASFFVGDSKSIHYIVYENATYNIKSYPLEKFNFSKEYVALQVLDDVLWMGGDDIIKRVDLMNLIENDTIIDKSYKIDKSLFGGIKRVGNLPVSNLIPTHDGQFMGKASNGLYMFDKTAYKFHDIPAKINLKKIELFAEEFNDNIYQNNDEVVLPYNKNYLTFHTEAISFTYPEDVKFKYRLKGLREGDEWSQSTSENKMVFSYLPPGNYAFEFTADNGNGVWQEKYYSYSFKIESPFWRNPWFWFFTILGISGITLISFYRRNIVKQKQAQQFSRDLINAQEQERTRISKDLHDSVGQQLTLIKKKAQNLEQTELSKMSNDALEEVRSISRDLYPATLKQLGFTQSVEQLVYDLDEGVDKFFTLEVDDDVDDQLDEEKALNLYRFIQESLSNVLKHSQAKAVNVKITKELNYIQTLISDNGKGFNSSEVKNSLGLKTMSERIKMLKGTLSIKSKLNEGTTLVAQIPV